MIIIFRERSIVMKRATAVIMCIIIAFSCFGINAFAKAESVPTVLVSGFLCSKLYFDFATENEESIWTYLIREAANGVKEDFSGIASSFYGMLKGNSRQFGETVGKTASEVLHALECMPDGGAGNRVGYYPNTPEKSNLAYMLENAEEYMYEVNFCKYLSTVTDPSDVFCFNYDSRLDAVTIADELAVFIDEITQYTGSPKVKIFALSYGGLITATYLTKYSPEKVERVVMSVPALGGTDLPDRILSGDVDLADESIVSFVMTILDSGSDFTRYFAADRMEWLDGFAKGLCSEIADIAATWGGAWSMTTADGYNELKNRYLDPEKNADFIEKLDYIHYTVRPNLSTLFRSCRENGIPVSILCGTGSALVAGGELNGDVILPAYGVSGARVAPLGKRLVPDKDDDLRYYSPSMEVDASDAYLPENTWFIENHRHGRYYYEEYTRQLVTKLLFTDEIENVDSDPAFPRFANSNHSVQSVDISEGVISSGNGVVNIKNISAENSIKILSVHADGVPIDFDDRGIQLLDSGESTAVAFKTDLSSVACAPARITVSYFKLGSFTPFCVSEFDVTVIGRKAYGNSSEKYVQVDFRPRLQDAINGKVYDFLVKTSLAEAAQCVYNTCVSIKKNIG